MAINFLNYRHSHLHILWGAVSGPGSKCRDWPGEDISEAEARAANEAKREARLSEAAEEQGGEQQTGRNTPDLLTLPWGRGWDKHPPPFLQPSFLWFPPIVFPAVAIRPC